MTSQNRLTFIVHLPAKPERYADLEAGVRQVLTDMSREPDFLNCTLHRSQNDPNTLVVYETWSCDREYFLQHHLPRHYRAEFERELPGAWPPNAASNSWTRSARLYDFRQRSYPPHQA
jgi:quinol monooxygenase YgiN